MSKIVTLVIAGLLSAVSLHAENSNVRFNLNIPSVPDTIYARWVAPKPPSGIALSRVVSPTRTSRISLAATSPAMVFPKP